MSDKQRFAASKALAVVRELLPALTPCCVPNGPEGRPWLKVAGSLRRKKAEVGDIEFVYVPEFGDVQNGLFSECGNLFDAALENLILQRIIAPRPNKNGVTAWGGKNKLAVHVASGIPIDFFATTVRDFWNYLVCRTGGAKTNLKIAMAAQERGLKWHNTASGFSITDADKANAALGRQDITLGRFLVVNEERDVFTFTGLPWLEPHQRD